MRMRQLLWGVPVAGAAGLGWYVDRLEAAEAAKQDLQPAVSLPVTRVVLFNSGVGYFTRGGEVQGEARVDLSFQEDDINDLLKSMVLEDFNGGRVAAVSYDSREPISRTLSSFAIDLNDSPSFAEIVQQARGERVEVTVVPTAVNQPGKLVGTVVGIEVQQVAAGNTVTETEVLNLWCAEGLRAVKLNEVQQLRFSNPVIEAEFRRALEVVALSHDSQKKAVSLHFAGEGKRKVQVGYVVEAPIWKTSYRLVLDGENKAKPYLQGWAMVENTTDEDWAGVKMALVSGRPISFKMDLYNPLFVPRPTVEPELFASLRPPTYSGGFKNGTVLALQVQDGESNGGRGTLSRRSRDESKPIKELEQLEKKMEQQNQLKSLDDTVRTNDPSALYARQAGKELSDRLDTGAIGSAATAGKLGDSFQYVIDHPVTLVRQKSAMLPIVGKDIDGQRVSIYNPGVQAKHPLLGLRLKNSTGLHLNQGPITVFEGSTYAGDTRVLDVQPNEERLVAFAIDLGTEVDPQNGPGSSKLTNIKAVKGIVTTTTKFREERKYRMVNRSQTDRVLLLEHPNRTNQQFKLVETEKPIEDTKDVYRFQVALKAGEEKTFVVNEERDVNTTVALSNSSDNQIRYFISLNEATPELKKKLAEALTLKGAWDGHRRELSQVVADLNRLNQDQDRIRKNLANTPKEAEVYMVYLKKLSAQEKEIDALTTRQKELMNAEFEAKKSYEDYISTLTD